MGKTWMWLNGYQDSIIDFDSTFKKALHLILGIDYSQDPKCEARRLEPNQKVYRDYRKEYPEEYEQQIIFWYNIAVSYAKATNKLLLVSDLCLLRECHNDFHCIYTINKETFIERCKQRNDYNEKSFLWKNNIDIMLDALRHSNSYPTERIYECNGYISDYIH